MKIVIPVDSNWTLEITDLEEESYLLEIKDHIDNVLTKATISKEDIKRLAKASWS